MTIAVVDNKTLTAPRLITVFLFMILLILPACSADRYSYINQVKDIVSELAVSDPSSPEAVFNFAAVSSARMRLELKGLGEDMIAILVEDGPWYEKLLLAYLLALKEDRRGFTTILELLSDQELPIDLQEGLRFCGIKYLGMTEKAEPVLPKGWQVDFRAWEDAMARIKKVGIHRWRLEYLQGIVMAGEPASGDRALKAASWLKWKLNAGDVPFLGDLLEKGSGICDVAILNIIETLLMQKFRPEGEIDSLDLGIRAFRQWYKDNRSTRPDLWVTKAFTDLGVETTDIFKQSSIPHLINLLFDESENWVLIRSRSLFALNRICGFRVDRSVIFMEDSHRRTVADAYQHWYNDLAARVLLN